MKKIKVLIVDDSALVRKIIRTGLEKDPAIEVVATAADPYIARDLLVEHKPDVMTLDVEMPKMDGVTFLKKFMPVMPTPTIIVSSLTEQGKQITLEAMEAGAIDVVAKPKVDVSNVLSGMMEDLVERVKKAAKIDIEHYRKRKAASTEVKKPEMSQALDQSTDLVIAIGSSAGGVEALSRILPVFPPATPGIVITQHMPVGYTASFAKRMNAACQMQVKEAEDNDRIRAGQILIAPGGTRHMEVVRRGGRYHAVLQEGPPVCRHCPSVDVLFNSVAKQVGKNAIAIILTGMGYDGADGLLAIKNAGGRTFTQDEATATVYGMPRVAFEKGGAEKQFALEDIPKELIKVAKDIAIC